MNHLLLKLAGLVACGLLLAGCFESASLLLDAKAARQPVTTAQDWTYGSGDHRVHARVKPRADGWYDYQEARVRRDGKDGPWKSHKVLLNTLGPGDGYDLYIYGTWDDEQKAWLYGLTAVAADGSWQTIAPSCDSVTAEAAWFKADVEAATRAGGKPTSRDGLQDVCLFTSQAALLAAMRTIAAAPGFRDRMKDVRK